MLRHSLLFLVVLSLAISGGAAWATSVFVDISATDGYVQAHPTGVATGGYTVSQGPMPTQSTLFYDTYLYPGGTTGTMTNLTTNFTTVNGRIGSTNMNAGGAFVACQTSPAFGANSTGGWTYSNGVATQLPYYYLPGPTPAYETYATAINNNGDTAGYYRASGGNDPTKPFIRTGGTDYALNDTTTYGSVITAMNTSGQAVGWNPGGGIMPPGSQATVWTYTISGGTVTSQSSLNLQGNGSPLSVAYPSCFASAALGINSSGKVVIAASNTGQNNPLIAGANTANFLYDMSTQGMTTLGSLLFYDDQTSTGTGTQFGGHAQIVNDSGQVVGFTGTQGSTWHAAVWQNGTITDLNTLYASILPAGFVLNNATAIDNHGDIAGYGTDASSRTIQAFVIYTPPMPGDANLDGTVDISDLSIVLANYDKTGLSWSQGDFDGNGTVDINDLSKILTNYDKTQTAGATGIKAVPEPSGIVLFGSGALGLLAWAWRKRR